MNLFASGQESNDSRTRQTEAAKNENQRRGRNNVTVTEVQCRSTKQTGRPIFGAKYKDN